MGRIILGAFLLLAAPIAFANSLTGKVVKITDGDTVYVLDANYKDHKIRLAGIDAPERKQACGLASRKHLASIVAGQPVTIEYQKRDRYGRIVGKVLLDGIDACLEQVKAGFAWHYKKYQHDQSLEDQRRYADAEIWEEQEQDEKEGITGRQIFWAVVLALVMLVVLSVLIDVR